MATTAVAKAPAEIPESAPKKKSKLLLIVVAAVVLLTTGGGTAWYFLGRSADDNGETRASSKPPVFLPVDQFTVNLQSEDGQQFLQVAMTLKVVDQAVADAIKALLPEVRSRILLLLSSKKASQLSTPEGKTRLAEEIIKEVEAPLPQGKDRVKPKSKVKAEAEDGKAAKKGKSKATAQQGPEAHEHAAAQRVLAVYFTHFIIQ